MSFLQTRTRLMIQHGWGRRVATLAARLYLGVDTWEGIAATPGFRGTPLLSQPEAVRIGCDVPGRLEGAAPPVTGAGRVIHPTFNIKGTQTGRTQGGRENYAAQSRD
jgi:hypothetical protein